MSAATSSQPPPNPRRPLARLVLSLAALLLGTLAIAILALALNVVVADRVTHDPSSAPLTPEAPSP